MGAGNSTGESAVRTAAQFATTHWSAVLSAADSASPHARTALEALCRTYWYPLYAFVRLKGHRPEDARDLTQAFFARLLEKHYLRNFSPQKGRFRTFLLRILQRFLCDEFDRATALKRGGRAQILSLDTAEAEMLLERTAGVFPSPETAYERAWADTVVYASMDRLQEDYAAEGKAAVFAELKQFLSRSANRAAYSQSAKKLGTSVDAVAMAIVRLRRRYRARVRAEIANTVATPAEIDDEMRYLVNLLAK